MIGTRVCPRCLRLDRFRPHAGCGLRAVKVIDSLGVTTEYVRCPDPTSNLVVKIIRTAVY